MFKARMHPLPSLSHRKRERIFDNTVEKVTKKYFDPKFNGTDWPDLAAQSRETVVAHENPQEFELAMNDLVRRLGTSHTGFFHQSLRRVPGRPAIGATLKRAETEWGRMWVIQDVHPGGPAHRAGLRSADVLMAIEDKILMPDAQPMFSMGADVEIRIRRSGEELAATVSIPVPRSSKQPYSEPYAVSWKMLPRGAGYLKVSIFPGLLGLDVAREIDTAILNLASCNRLIIDLRGHLGGGLGVLRLMSHLTPDKLPIGYTVTRKRAENGYEKNALPVLDQLPTHLSNPLAIGVLAMRFAGRDPSVRLLSEGVERQRWHGRIAILVNEHTVSAGEMAAAFAAENNLAKIVGTETAGRLIPGSGFDVGCGYMLIIPKAEYITWKDQKFEGRGVKPDFEAPWSVREAGTEDNQVEIANDILSSM